ncbi:MAG TPA: TolC family outer membrane protein [Burkholderiales bacterium]|jgi:outer membrane protein|nr:TolC family outer membrane protein [Burkholderiales bacterium]
MRFLIVLIAFVLPVSGNAQSLLEVFRDARTYDAQYASARYALQAGIEKLPQGRALILPTLNLQANTLGSRFDANSNNDQIIPSFKRDFTQSGMTLTFTQPVYRPQNWIQYEQGELQVRQAEAVFGQAAQDLILRVAQAYFDVLAAQDTLALVRAQKAAISEQLAQAKRNFEVGTATITDTHEAQARYDLTLAQEIQAQNEVDTRHRALQQLTGKEYAALKSLRPDVKLSVPNPNNMQSWVDIAERSSYPVQVQEATTRIADLEAKRNRAAHLPTVDLVASQFLQTQSGSAVAQVGSELSQSTISLQLAVPLYAGGALSSREREAAANYEKSRQDLENARRTSALQTRQFFLLVANGIAAVAALEQALVSSQSALDSNKLGYEVGVRINIDVLNAQQQLFSTRRDLAVARYNTITNHLRLKSAAGSLSESDLDEVNRALAL